MSSELETYAQELCWILDQVSQSIDGLTKSQLGWQPAPGSANSASVIASHILGCTRVYVLGFGCNQPVSRDRPAEFAVADVSAHDLVTALRHLADEITAALAVLPPTRLGERLLPPQELWGTGQVREIARREAFVESIRHAALHLGELRLTRDLAIQNSEASAHRPASAG